MRKQIRHKFLSGLVLAALLILMMGVCAFAGEEEEDPGINDPADVLVPYETVNPDHTVNPGFEIVTTDPDAESIDVLRQEALDTINSWSETVVNCGPFSNEVVLGAMKESDGVASSKSGFSAEKNHVELVDVDRVDNSNAEDYIYVIDENAYVMVLKDGENSYVADATVTLTYNDESGQSVTRSVKTTGGNVPGLAVFDGMKGFRYALVNIQKEGYEKITLMQEDITGGCVRTISMEKTRDNSLYVRCADLGGKDLFKSDTVLNLVEKTADKVTLSVMITKTGTASLPGTVTIKSETDGRTIATIGNPTYYQDGSASDTYYFRMEGDWLKQNTGLFKADDVIKIEFGSSSLVLDLFTIKNAIIEPAYNPDAELPVSDPDLQANLDGAFPSSGLLNFSGRALGFEVAMGFYPDGSFFIAGTYEVQGLSDDFSTLFPKSANPKVREGSTKITDKIKSEYKKNVEKIKTGKQKIKGAGKEGFVDSNGKVIGMSFNLCFTGSYNEKLKKYEGDLSFVVSVNGTVGQTLYTVIDCGPVVIPFYMGYEFGLNFSTYSEWIFRTDSIFPLGRLEFADDASVAGAFHLMPSLSAYIGSGIRGIIGADLDGNISFDLGLVVDKWKMSDTPQDHAFIDAVASLNLNYYYIMGSGSVKLMTTDKIRIADSWDETTLLTSRLYKSQLKPIDLSACEEKVKNETSGTLSNGLGLLPTYESSEVTELNQETLTGTTDVIAYSTLVDNQVQVISTEHYTAVFRIISKDGTTKLVYQFQDESTGRFENTMHEVQMPGGEAVFEYNVSEVKAHYLGEKTDYAYVAAVCGDISETDMDKRGYTTSVAGITLNLATNEELHCETKSPAEKKGKVCFFNPMPAGDWERCLVAYSTCESQSTRDKYKNYMVSRENKEVFLSENVPFFSTNDSFRCFWTEDTSKSTEDTFVFKGVDMYGKSPDTGFFSVPLDISDWDSDECPITCMSYMNGVAYLIAKNKVYYLKPVGEEGNRHAEFCELTYQDYSSAEMNASNTSYTMFTDAADSMVYIVSARKVYDPDSETLTGNCTGTEIKVSFIVDYFSSYYGSLISLHGERSFMIDGVEMVKFGAGINRKSGETGMVFAYNTYTNDSQKTVDTYSWQENARNCLVIKDFYVNNVVVTNTQKYISATVKYQNDGYALEGPIHYVVQDGSGYVLQQALYDQTDGTYDDLSPDQGYYIVNLYPSDYYVQTLYFKTNPNWKTNEEQKITIYIDRTSANEEPVKVSDTFTKSYLELTGKQSVVEGRHVAELSLTNLSVVQGEMPEFVVVGHFDSEDREFTGDLAESSLILGTVNKGSKTLLNRNVDKERYSAQTYNTSLDLEQYWKEYTKDGLKGVYVIPRDEDGNQVDEQKVYLENPYYSYQGEDPEPETTTPEETEPKTEPKTEPEATTAPAEPTKPAVTTAETTSAAVTTKKAAETSRATMATTTATTKETTEETAPAEEDVLAEEAALGGAEELAETGSSERGGGLPAWAIVCICVGGAGAAGGGAYAFYRWKRK